MEKIATIKRPIVAPQTIINGLCIYFTASYLWGVWKQFGLISYTLNNIYKSDVISVLIFFIPIVITPLFIVLFWKRKKSGWIIFAVFLCYVCVPGILLSAIYMVRSYPISSWITALLSAIFHGTCLWLISRETIRNIYSIRREVMLSLVAGIGILSVLVAHILYN